MRRPVIITTEFGGVFFGYAEDTSGETVRLKRARLAIFWSQDVNGFMGLAATGPSDGCRIGPRADIELRKVTSVIEVSSEAVAKWELA